MVIQWAFALTTAWILVSGSLAAAGPLLSQSGLLNERARVCGESFFDGYVAGVADTVVGLQRVSRPFSLGILSKQTEQEILAHRESDIAGGYTAVIRAMKTLGMVSEAEVRRMFEATPR